MEERDELNLDFSKLKKIKLAYLLLIIFLMFGFYLRVYHLDFPAIGYHNMKENEYLDESYFFLDEGNFLHKQAFAFYGLDEGAGYHEEYAQVPLIPYITTALWAVFGQEIWIPRLLMILFMLGSILLTYVIVKQLTENEYLSLLSAFLMTIMPLGIFFGRNIQPESPGLFLILLTAYFFIKWMQTKSRIDLFYSGLAFSFAWAIKYSFAIIFFPLLFIFPFKDMYNKFKEQRAGFYKDALYLFLGGLPGIISTLVYELTIVDPWKEGYRIEVFRIFDTGYWTSRMPALFSFIRDNYTWWFFWFAVIGLIFVLFKYRTLFSRFMLGYAFSVFVFVDLMAAKIGGHSYYQMPYLPLVCILSAYFLFSIGSILKQLFKHKWVMYVPLLLLLLTIPEMQAANDRVWATNFYGQDVVGQWIKERTMPEDRLIAKAHSQNLAVCSYAKRRCGWVNNVTELLHKESVFNIPYIYFDSNGIPKLDETPELKEYLFNNYKLVLVGALRSGQGLVPMQFVLQKGGKFNMTDIQNIQPRLAKTYDMKQGKVEFYLIENE